MNMVAAHLLDGRVIKGTTMDARPNSPMCHVRTDAGPVEVQFADCKAIYFLKDLVGDPAREDRQEEEPGDPRAPGMRRAEIVFRDGERLVAFIAGYPPRQQYYFVLPVDAGSNNLRILVNQDAIQSMESPDE